MRQIAFCIAMMAWLMCCGQRDTVPVAAIPPGHLQPEKVSAAHLPNALRIHPKVISGGQPDGEAGFRELQGLGIKTIISVDGAAPDVETAKQFGLRYVHLPFGYDGIPDERVQELAKAVRDLEGPIYIHCHHGQHRSPTAAAVACVADGLIEPDVALGVLYAGRHENYRGLYQAAEAARPLNQRLLDRLKIEYRETVSPPPLAKAMLAIEHTHDHLKDFDAKGWQPLASQPDLDAAHEALLLREHFTELLRTEEVQSRPARFQDLLREGESSAEKLEAALRNANGAETAKSREASAALASVTQNCATCHREFRDVPLSEKMAR